MRHRLVIAMSTVLAGPHSCARTVVKKGGVQMIYVDTVK